MSAITVLTVEDKVAIQELLARYCRVPDAFVACFASDCTIVRRHVRANDTPNLAGRRHHVGRVVMERKGESVAVKSFSLVTECHGEPSNRLQFAGFYLDVTVKLETRWLFKTRVIRRWDTEALKLIRGRRALEPVGRLQRDERA